MNVRKIFGTALAATVLAGSLAGSAFAAEPTNGSTKGQVIINPGTITASISGGDFGDTAYSFSDQTVKTSEKQNFIINVTDLRGTGQGWTVSVSAQDFKGADTGTKFGADNLSLHAVGITVRDGQAKDGVESKSDVKFESSGTAVQDVVTAKPKHGMGSYDAEFEGELVIPGGTLSDTYTSTLTVSVVSAPKGA